MLLGIVIGLLIGVVLGYAFRGKEHAAIGEAGETLGEIKKKLP
jgi:Na+/H+-translocating membrane pyrophosphatase